jgi:hypothetical protein
MSSQLGEAFVPIRATLDKLDKDMAQARNKIDSGLKKSESSAKSFGSVLGKLAATGALLEIGRQALRLGKASIETASDIEEAASKFNYVFGPAAESTGNRLDDFAEAANRSRFEMRSMAADVGALTESTLGSKEAAGEMAVAVSELAVDLASFNNVTEDEALTALKAGLIGEAEPMRRFGVLLSAAAVESRVLADGMANSKSEITDAMKVQARYNIIMEQTATAQGDAIRTSDSYANVSRGLEAATQELLAAIGQGLLPAATETKEVMTDLVRQFTDFVKIASTGADQVRESADAGMEQAETFDEVADRLARVNESYRLSRTLLGRFTGTQDEVHDALEDTIKSLVATSDNYETFIKATEEAGLTTTDVANIMNLFESDLHGNTEAWYELAAAQAEVIKAGEEVGIVDQNLANYISDTTTVTDELVDSTVSISEAWSHQPTIIERLNSRYKELKQNAENQRIANEGLLESYQDILDGNTLLISSYDKLGEQFYTVGGRTADQNENLEELRKEYNNVQESIRSLQGGTASLGLTEDELNEKLAKQQERANELVMAMAPLEAIKGDVASRDIELAFNMEAVNQAMYDAAVQAGADVEAIARLDIARGNLTKTQAEAILMEAMVRGEAERLGQAYADGTITVQEMDAQMQDFITTLMSTPPDVSTKVSVETAEAHDKLDKLIRKLVNFDGKTFRARAEVTTSGSVPGDSGGSDGKGDNKNNNHATGTNGWLTVPSGFANDSYTVGLSSGEMYAVIPDGMSFATQVIERGSPNIGAGVTIQVDARGSTDPREVERRVESAVDRALKRAGLDADRRIRT